MRPMVAAGRVAVLSFDDLLEKCVHALEHCLGILEKPRRDKRVVIDLFGDLF